LPIEAFFDFHDKRFFGILINTMQANTAIIEDKINEQTFEFGYYEEKKGDDGS